MQEKVIKLEPKLVCLKAANKDANMLTKDLKSARNNAKLASDSCYWSKQVGKLTAHFSFVTLVRKSDQLLELGDEFESELKVLAFGLEQHRHR